MPPLPIGRFLAGLLACCLVAAPRAQFSSSVDLVEVYATVTDRSGAPVTGLPAEAFDVLEDGRPQVIQAFAAGDFPLSVALALDHSASMAGRRLASIRTAARGFLHRLRAEDQAMVIGISSEVEVLAPLSRDRAAQDRAIEGLQPWSTTSLNDAVIAGMQFIEASRGRRALVVLSDGEDRYSEATADQVLAHARRSRVMVYPIAVGKRLPPLFPELAVLTGGRSFHVQDLPQLDRTFAEIARELRYQYLLGYAPNVALDAPHDVGSPSRGNAGDTAWHSIQVRVRRPDVQVRARDGYWGTGK